MNPILLDPGIELQADCPIVGRCPRTTSELLEVERRHCENELVLSFRQSWHEDLDEMASMLSIPLGLIWIQICLHLPIFSELTLRELRDNKMPRSLKDVVLRRFDGYRERMRDFNERSMSGSITTGDWHALGRDQVFVSAENHKVRYRIEEVSERDGIFIEENLHYLRSRCTNAVRRLGLFLDGAELPVCYFSLAAMDRRYKLASVSCSLGRTIDPITLLNLSRVFGFGKLPRNTISLCVSSIARHLELNNVNFLTTAVNPLLGFTGISMMASGFRPYALCPVAYNYSEHGAYRSRRFQCKQAARMSTPPNVLFIRGQDAESRMLVDNLEHVRMISETLHNDIGEPEMMDGNSRDFLQSLESIREYLERGWNDLTRYHGTSYSERDPISKGQCGVTSAYLARQFQKKGFEVLFCEGDVEFPDRRYDISKHCWIRLPKLTLKSGTVYDLVIDLTADQGGYPNPVICETDKALARQGIYYRAVREVDPQVVNYGHLSRRLTYLQSRVIGLMQ